MAELLQERQLDQSKQSQKKWVLSECVKEITAHKQYDCTEYSFSSRGGFLVQLDP